MRLVIERNFQLKVSFNLYFRIFSCKAGQKIPAGLLKDKKVFYRFLKNSL